MVNLTYRWINMLYLCYTTYISVDIAHHELFCAKVGKGGISTIVQHRSYMYMLHVLKLT